MKPLKRNLCLQNNKLVRYHTFVSQYYGIITAFIFKKKNLYSENQEAFPKKRKTQEGNREETEQKTITEGKVRPVLLL